MTKKIISIFVAVMMILSIIPAAAFASEGTKLSSPATEKSSPATEKSIAVWDFEEDPTANDWQFADEDGDGHNWTWTDDFSHSSSHSIMSESYGAGAYHPDNWAISPEFTVPEGGAEVTMFVKNYSGTYPENYGVYVITADGANEIATGQSAAGSGWNEKSYNISDFAGATVMFAIRHYNVSDMWKFYIDDITVELPPDPNVITEADVSGFPARITDNMTVDELTAALTVPENADYEIADAFVYDMEAAEVLDSSAALEVGSFYMVGAQIAPVEGKTFALDAELTANGGALMLNPAHSGVDDATTAYICPMSIECGATPVMGFYFETDPAEDGWQFIDADGDGNNWYWLAYGINYGTNNDSSIMAYEGVGHITSASYLGAALHPDNWAISPEFEVPAVEPMLSMYIGAQDPSYAAEHYTVYVGTGTDVESYTAISDEVVVEGIYTKVEFDLADYAGETVSIAIRHYNCSDMFRLNLDQVEVFGESEQPSDEPIVIDTVEIIGLDAPVLGGNPDMDVTVPEDAHYTLTKVEWHAMNKAIVDGDYVITPGTYYVVFEFEPEEGYEFGAVSDTTMIINGSSDLVGLPVFCYSFPNLFHMESTEFVVEDAPAEPELINTIEINDFVEPAWGENPFFGVTVPDDANYTLESAMWNWWSEEDFGELAETDIFDHEDYEYTMLFVVTPNEGYEFSEDATVTINGEQTLVDGNFTYIETDSATFYTIGFYVEEPAPAPTLDEALNVEGGELHFESEGAYPWIVVNDEESGRLYAMSGNAGVHSSDSILTTTITANAGDVVSFEFQAWGEGTSTFWDYCEFAIDGERVGYWGAYQNEEWELFTSEPMTAGEHTLTWKFHKDNSVSKPGDCFMVDNVEITEGELPVTGILGDVDMDGEVTTADALMALRYVMGLIELNEDQLAQADVTGEGEVTVADPLLILRHTMGLIESFPAEEP